MNEMCMHDEYIQIVMVLLPPAVAHKGVQAVLPSENGAQGCGWELLLLFKCKYAPDRCLMLTHQ